MADYNSDRDVEDLLEAPKKRQRRHTFKNFAQRVAEVDVDVYRRAPVRSEPLPGATSFFQEELQKMRELHTTSDFLQAAAALNPLVQTLPQLVHHKNAVVEILLGAVRMDAALSLEPILTLLSVLARDLLGDFVPYVPRVIDALTHLIEQGADREPELLQHVFGCLSSLFRHLVRQLVADLAAQLALTARLRYHRADHVRRLAARSAGFLFRHAGNKSLRAGVRAVFAEHALRPSEERAHGAGLLLAEAVIGVSNGLHSKASLMLPLLLQEDVLDASRIKPATEGGRVPSREALRERGAAVVHEALERLLDHGRRGKLGPLWDAALDEAGRRLHSLQGTTPGPERTAAVASAARAVTYIAQMTEVIRGSRVEDYAPLFALTARLGTIVAAGGAAAGAGDDSAVSHPERAAGAADPGAEAVLSHPDESPGNHPGRGASLPGSALRLVAAVVAGHGKDVGASAGLAAISQAAPGWAPLLRHAPIDEVLLFVREILHGAGAGPTAAAALGPLLLGALGRGVMAGNAAQRARALPLLVDACDALRPEHGANHDAVPLLLTAQPDGVRLAAFLRELATKDDSPAAELWAALRCLPHACQKPDQVVAACIAVTSKTSIAQTKGDSVPPEDSEGLVFLHCQALLLRARIEAAHSPDKLTQPVLQLLQSHPCNFHALATAADIFETCRTSDALLPEAQLMELLPLLASNLSVRSQSHRAAALKVLCSFQQPALPSPGSGQAAESQERSDILPRLAQIESQTCTLDSGRAAATAIGRMKTALEYGRVPPALVDPLVRSLLGILYVRFSMLWAPASEALGMALKSSADVAWPLILDALRTWQAEFLSGSGKPHSAPGAAARGDDGSDRLQSIEERFQWHVAEGSADRSGGCTDAAMRMNNLLKALAAASTEALEPRSADWVPLLLAYLGSRSPQISEETPAHAEDAAETPEDANEGDEYEEERRRSGAAAGPSGRAAGRAGLPRTYVGARAWRALAKEWMAALAIFKSLKGVHRWKELRAAVALQLLASDPSLQQAALKCLKGFKLKYLGPYMERLLRLAADASLREELTAFPLSPTADAAIQPEHRAGLTAVLVRLLWPKMRKRSGRLGGKGAPGSARAAILNFLTALEPPELRPLLVLFLSPLASGFAAADPAGPPAVAVSPAGDPPVAGTGNAVGAGRRRPGATAAAEPPAVAGGAPDWGAPAPNAAAEADALYAEPWWAAHLGREGGGWWLSAAGSAALAALPSRQRVGFLNATGDLLRHLGHKLEAYLPEIVALLVCLLEGAVASLPSELPAEIADNTSPVAELDTYAAVDGASRMEEGESNPEDDTEEQVEGKEIAAEEGSAHKATEAAALDENSNLNSEKKARDADMGAREVRSGALRLLAAIWARFPAAADYAPFWPRFFAAAAPLLPRMLVEASADKAPPLLEVAAAFAATPSLAPLLGDRPSQVAASEGATCPAEIRLEPWACQHHLGSRLLQQTIAVLAAPHASEAARGVALGTLESVLDLGQSHAAVILGPHTSVLLDSLRALVAAAAASGGGARPKRLRPGVKVAARGPTRADALRALAVLERVAAGGGTAAPDLAQQLSAALLPILTPGNSHGRGKRADEAASVRVLAVLAAVWSQAAEAGGGVPQAQLWRYAAALAPLAGSLTSREARAAHTAAFDALGRLLPPLQRSARLLSGLNAMSATELDAPDYDRRLGAYSELDQAAWGSMRATEALPLLHAALADVRNADDLAARAAASQALSRLIAAAAAARLGPEPGGAPGDAAGDAVPEQPSEQSGEVAGGGNVVALAERVLYSQLKRTLASPNLAVRQEHVDLLRQLVCAFPDRFQDLGRLIDADPELDFFNNVAHLQLHRRSRAFYRLKKAAGEGSLGAGALLGVAVPLLQQVIVEGKEGEGAGHERKEKDRDREANVSAAAIEALGAVAGSLGWSHYRELLNLFMRVMQKNDSKAVIRALCAIIDAFHFPTAATSAEGDADISADAAEIQTALTKRVLPALQVHLVNTEREAVRAPVALAVVKLLKHLPPAVARAALPAALQKVANLLKLRLQRIRDDARTVLVAMVAELGPQYLCYAIDTLRSALPRRGYMGHVQGYTVHALLAGLMKRAEPGALDDVLEDVLEVIEAEVWGEIGEEKEAGAFVGGCKEAKRARGVDSYQLLASGITFRTHIGPLLQPVTERLSQASSPAVRRKLQALLQAAIQGVAVNPTVTTADLLVFVHGAMDSGLAAEEAARAAAAAAAEAAGQAPANGSAGDVHDGSSARHQHLMVEAALRLLLRALRKGNTASDRSPANLGMLDGLLPVLGRALRSRHAAVTERALRCLALLAPLPLPALPVVAPEAGAAVLSMLRQAPDCNAPIAQEGFKLLAALLRSCSSYKPKEGQLRDVLGRAFADVEAAANTVGAFNLLKAVITRRLVLPEVYDLMSRVQELMIKSHSASVRAQCSAILLAFLLDYPLGGARLAHHLNFLVANAGFEHEAGREAALDAMLAVIQKFPDSLLETWAPVFFVPLVARLVSDPSPKCRALVGRTLKALLLRATPVLRDRFASHCLRWLAGSDARLGRAAAQTLGILAEAEGPGFGRRTAGILPQLLATLRADSPQENAAPGWQVCYACLLLLEKIVTSSPAQVRWAAKSGEVREVWLQLPQLLTHRHLWVRKAASRLLGLAFADSGIGEGLLAEEEAAPGRLAFLLFIQLEAEAADEALLSQATKNLVFLAPRLLAADVAAGRVPKVASAKTGDAANTGDSDAAKLSNGNAANSGRIAEVGDADVDADVDDDMAGDRDGDVDGAAGGGLSALTLHGLIRRMARLADDRSWPRQGARLAALRFAAALGSRLGRDDLPPYLPTMLLPLHRITESNAANPDEVKALAEEVLAHLREVAGSDALLAAYNRARQTVNSARNERRRQRTLQAMLDPEAAAQARMRKQERRAVGRKRAMEETRRLRSAGVAVKHKRPRGPKRAD